jgi:acyl-CoA synthetase (AMP-forming)/AMP-acid ligase II
LTRIAKFEPPLGTLERADMTCSRPPRRASDQAVPPEPLVRYAEVERLERRLAVVRPVREVQEPVLMVISGGTDVYPVEIEACLLELDGVRDVAVVGIPDDEFGEAPVAHVDVEPSAALTENAVRERVRARLAGFKVPRVIVFDHDLPREETGKIFKRRIRRRYWEHAGRKL